MMLGTLILGERSWLGPSALIALIGLLLVVYSYRRVGTGRATVLSATLKVVGLLLIIGCLLEPLWSSTRARPGANQFVLLVDNSRSLEVRDNGADETRGETIAAAMREASVSPDAWHVRLQQDFDVRRYVVGTRLTRVRDYENLEFDGTASSLSTALHSIAERYQNRPLAGVLVVSDGNITDLAEGRVDTAGLPPVYPVVVGDPDGLRDLRVSTVAVRETPFEDAPVTITAAARSLTRNHGDVTAELLDESGDVVATKSQPAGGDDANTFGFRFQVRPSTPGVAFYRLQATGNESDDQEEATFDNNEQLVCVNRDHRKRRVLYISGRPNWEYKFLRRAIQHDDQLDLVGLIRVARREAKFDFRGRAGESSNSLYRGFREEGDEEIEEYDQPVLIRLDTVDETELRDGFPKSAAELFAYDGVIIDDIESSFFTADQHDLLDEYVSLRGGGLLMLGGQESFRNGGYDRTPIGRMLPVYLDRPMDIPDDGKFRLNITREGRLQPWMRLREDWDAEQTRLARVPPFRTVNRISTIKPGAMVLASVTAGGSEIPAIVTQSFGKGKTAAITVGDLWRWRLREDRPVEAEKTDESDQATAWRQILRWLVVDVPQRVSAEVQPAPEVAPAAMRITVRVRDEKFEPVENATVKVAITTPEKETVELEAEAGNEAGRYETVYVSRSAGAFRAKVMATGPDGTESDFVQGGWASDPARDEFASVAPNTAVMADLAAQTGGELVDLDELDDFVARLSTKDVPVTEQWTWPLWHQSWVFLLAIACLVSEWGLRRMKGLP